MMLPIRKSQIGERLSIAGFNAKEFELVAENNHSYKLIYTANPAFYYELNGNVPKYCPGVNGNIIGSGRANQWEDHFKSLQIWLNALKANLKVIDPWTELKETFSEDQSNAGNYEDFLTDEEQVKFANVLDQLLIKMEELNIRTEQIAKDMEHLKEMSAKISKKDIALLLLGSGTSYVMQGLIPSEKASTLLKFIQDSFKAFKGYLLS
jgi:hypothetical protein